MMNKFAICIGGLISCVAVVSCREVDGPSSHVFRIPVSPAFSQGPPVPQTYTVSSNAYSATELINNNYLYDTWIVVRPNGPMFYLEAYAPAKPVTGYYGATGAAGGRNGCDLNSIVSFGQVYTGFGNCGGGGVGGNDTTVARGQGFIKQGSFPLDFAAPDLSDCPPHTSGTCHQLELVDRTFTVWPIPVTMKQVKAVPRTVNFNSMPNGYVDVAFTTGANPDSLVIHGGKVAMPISTTHWVYRAGDGTLDGNMCPGGYPIVTCIPHLHKAGRMVVDAFTGGWEQSSTVTVQCLTNPADSILNDTTNDFQVRSALLKMLDSAHPEVPPGFGYDSVKGRGLMHEITGNIWKLPNGGGYMLVPFDSSKNTECVSYHDSAAPPPVPNAVRVGRAHTHQNPWNKPVYGCETKVTNNGRDSIQFSKFPGDTANGKRPYIKNRKDFEKGGSGQDWLSMMFDLPPKTNYVIDADGTVAEVSYYTLANAGRIHNWAPSTANKCAWVR
jgi:hypothetical protein